MHLAIDVRGRQFRYVCGHDWRCKCQSGHCLDELQQFGRRSTFFRSGFVMADGEIYMTGTVSSGGNGVQTVLFGNASGRQRAGSVDYYDRGSDGHCADDRHLDNDPHAACRNQS